MYNPQLDIANFMIMCNQEVAESPTTADEATRLLRARLLFEEVSEFIEASGCFIGVDEEGIFTVFTDPDGKVNLKEINDSLADINYVSYGASNAFGLNSQLAHDEVHGSNMTKVFPDGTVHKNEFGKVIKPETYTPANMNTVLDVQLLDKDTLIEQLKREG